MLQSAVEQTKRPPTIPDTDAFKAWVKTTITILEVSPFKLSEGANVAPNTVSKLLNDEHRGVTLRIASRLVAHAKALAAEKGKRLPEFEAGEV